MSTSKHHSGRELILIESKQLGAFDDEMMCIYIADQKQIQQAADITPSFTPREDSPSFQRAVSSEVIKPKLSRLKILSAL